MPKMTNDKAMTNDEAIKLIQDDIRLHHDYLSSKYKKALRMAIESLSTESKWIIDDKPTEDGKYIVTLDAFGHHRFIDILCYGKPLMPNREVSGKCWYRTYGEWGDVVYDDEDILAWVPMKPYEGRREP